MKEGEDVTFVINHRYRLENLEGLIRAQSQEIIEEKETANEGGPRCCKSSVRAAIYEAVGFLNEFFDAGLNAIRMEKACAYSQKHDYCKKTRCRFFGQ